MSEKDKNAVPETQGMERPAELVHRMNNHLAIILGFCELLLEDLSDEDPRRADVREIQKAASAARSEMPEISRRLS
jgi:hypothetical protein